jgi:hypothetical protein
MPKASKKTTQVTPKKEKPSMQKKVMPEKGNGKLLKLEHVKLSALLLSPVSMVSSQLNISLPKVMAMDAITLQ